MQPSELPAPRLGTSSPKGHWLLGHLPGMRSGPLEFLERCVREHGDAVRLRMGPRRAVVLGHPSLIAEVVAGKHRSFRKHFALRTAKTVLREGLLTSEGERWLRQRRQAQPAFQGEALRRYAPIMVGEAIRQLPAWPVGEAFDLHPRLMRLTASIVSLCLFGAGLGQDAEPVEAAMGELTDVFRRRLYSPLRWPFWVPTALNRRGRRAAYTIERVLERVLSERRSQPGGQDLLAALIQARDQQGSGGMSDAELRDQMVTLFFAGHETTANALTWTWWLLARHPLAEERLVAELGQVLAGRTPTLEDLPRLRWTAAIIEESLRLMPPAWIFGREALERVWIGPLELQKGTTVLMSPWVLHRDPRWFDQPLEYQPGRWLDGLDQRLAPCTFIPFGGGPRVCIGAGFARMEMVLVLATIAQRLRLTLAPGAAVAWTPTITLRPCGSVPMQATLRG